MHNHDQKTRDMARSILPSTARRISRERKKGSARRARARNNARLARLMTHLDDLDGFEEDLNSYDLDDNGCDSMVEDRRDADKVGPIIRWAKALINSRPRLAEGDYWARRNYFSGLLGDTLAGRHALQHLDYLFGEANPWLFGRYPGYPTDEELAERRRADARAKYLHRKKLLAEVLAGADVRRLNARIAALTPPMELHWVMDRDYNWSLEYPPDSEPWLLGSDTEMWLKAGAAHLSESQAIAFRALDEVHAEMFGIDPE